MKEVFGKLKAHRLSSEFLYPVDWLGMGLFDYPSIIPCPMDLSTVERKLTDHEYRHV
jgi:bromodomain-containing factor 1